MFSKSCFPKPPPEIKRLNEKIKFYEARLLNWKAGHYFSLWNERSILHIQDVDINDCEIDFSSKKGEKIMARVSNLVASGSTTKACRILNSKGVAPYSDEILDQMIRKHPQGEEINIPIDIPTPFSSDKSSILKNIQKLAGASSPIDILTADLLLQAISSTYRDNLLSSLKSLSISLPLAI